MTYSKKREQFRLAIIILTLVLWFFIFFNIFIYINADRTPIYIEDEPSYEQGLWDGFNGGLEYLHSNGYLKDTTINLEILDVNESLHSINEKRKLEKE